MDEDHKKGTPLKLSTVAVALGLIVSALSAQAANIKISSLPIAITASGTYVMSGSLTFSVQSTGSAAITISTAIQRPVNSPSAEIIGKGE
jgi:hypothetical protein